MTREIENNQVEHDISHVPTKEQLQGIDPLEVKKRAITAALVVELDHGEAVAWGIAAYDQLGEGDEQLELDLLESRFDPSEYSDNYEIIPDSLLTERKWSWPVK